MTKTELKQKAQDNILHGIVNSFYNFDEFDELTEEQKTEMYKEMSKQFARIEKLFGYEQYSWTRG